MVQYRFPDRIDPCAFHGAAGEDRRAPVRAVGHEQCSKPSDTPPGYLAAHHIVAVSLVDDNGVGHFEHAPFDPFSSSLLRHHQHQKKIDHGGDGGLRLTTPTVSMITTSKPAASQTSMVSRVFLPTPPRVPLDGTGE